MLNIDNVVVGTKRNLALGLRIGDTKLWTALHEVEIMDFQMPTGAGAPTLHNVRHFDNRSVENSIMLGAFSP